MAGVEIRVQSSAAINDKIAEFEQLIAKFYDKRDELNQEEQRLVQKWTGDASTALNQRWNQEITNFDNFRTVFDEYLAALRQMLENIEMAEEANVQIVNS